MKEISGARGFFYTMAALAVFSYAVEIIDKLLKQGGF